MIISQTPIDWALTLEHSVTIGVIMFCGYGLAWIAVRLFGKGGLIAGMNDTMVQIKDLIGNQQVVCAKHVGTMDHICAVEETMLRQMGEAVVVAVAEREQIKDNVTEILDHAKSLKLWGSQNVKEFKITPAFDAIIALVTTAERIAEHLQHGEPVIKDIRLLKAEITAIKESIRHG